MTDTLSPGDAILIRGTGWEDWGIRFGARVKYAGWWASLRWLAKWAVGRAPADQQSDPWWPNHAAIFIGDGQIAEALAQGVVMSPASRYAEPARIVVPLAVVRPAVTDLERAAAVTHAKEAILRHDRYGWLSILSIIVQLLTPAKLDVSWDGAVICSALVAQCWEHAGVELPTRSALTTTPADLRVMGLAPLKAAA